jgi:polyhydroxyalkanoate synthase
MTASEESSFPSTIDSLSEPIDPFTMAQGLVHLSDCLQDLAVQFLDQAQEKQLLPQEDFIDPWVIVKAFFTAGQKILENPVPALQASHHYFKDYMTLCRQAFISKDSEAYPDVITPLKGDKRFKDPHWKENPIFHFMMQAYLLWDKWLKEVINSAQTLDDTTRHKVQFYAAQLSNALSPSNYLWSNPSVLKRTIETQGQNLIQGFQNFLDDLQQGQGQLKISMVDRKAFKVGVNIATTPGKVIFQNDLLQLIQYAPTTEKVFTIPVLLVPPCINKFYIYDLRPDNSFVRWLLDKGFTIFMISWVNPDKQLAHKTFSDYVCEGVSEAVETVRHICKVPQVNAIGFCIGGNFLVSYTAWKTALKARPHPLASATYLATLFDFKNAGDLLVFIDEEQFADLERKIQHRGYFDGTSLARAFNLLRANDLIWSFVINNYLLGQEPQAFDLLFWNSDATNLPAAMYLFYLKHFFINNGLMTPGSIHIKDQPIDIRAIKVPSFILSTREDHIAPWPSGYAGAQLFGGPTRFVLGGSGHIAGIFNHPKVNKYSYWVGPHQGLSAEEWLHHAQQKPGSWWEEWAEWLKGYSGHLSQARTPGSSDYPPLEDAPGSYVLK